ncbi:MAG: hypothetical protein SFV81_04440 [Pirellulaceae bacterium]|nr:hypothetical protein [Pirellulaceae bacterium]
MKHANASIITAQCAAIMLACFAFVAPSHAQTPELAPVQMLEKPQERASVQSSDQSPRADLVSFPTSVFRSGERTQVQVGLPTASPTTADRLIVQPKVQVGTEMIDPLDSNWLSSHRPSAILNGDEQSTFLQEVIPSPPALSSAMEVPPPLSRQSILEQPITPYFETMVNSVPPPARHRRFFGCSPGGLGRERLAFSLFDIDPAQPFNNFRVRTVVGNRMRLPDRAEYFWAKAGSPKGPPLGESVLNYQEARLRMELGSKKFSTAFEVPFRSVDPQFNDNHAGLGDLQLITKTVLLDGEQWMLTQYFGTHFATGHAAAGLGTGHFGLEPGLLFRNEFHESTWMHGELKFWFPLGADPQHGGQVLKLATGLSHVWAETDQTAWIPSLELTSFSVLNGLATDAFGTIRPIDQDTIFNLTPGLHYAVDKNGDFGLFEIGSSIALAVSDERFTDSTWNFDLRWSW